MVYICILNTLKRAEMSDKTTFYENLEKKLEAHHKFPSSYLFKFIFPKNEEDIAQLKSLFSPNAELTFRDSKAGKYTSATGKDMMPSAESVIKIYKKAEKIEGLISL